MANNSTSFDIASSRYAFCLLSSPHSNNTNLPDTFHPTWTFIAIVNGFASLPTVVLNALIVCTVFGDEDLRSSNFNVLLGFLAVTDLLVGLLVEPSFSVLLGCFVNDCHSPCQFTIYVLLTLACCGTTTVTLALASAERYLAIEHPNFYLQNITGKKVMTATIISWTVFLVCSFTGSVFMNKSYPDLVQLPLMVEVGLGALVILYCSFKVQLTAHRHRRVIALQRKSVQDAQSTEEQKNQEERLQEYKQVFMLTILVAISVLFYIPFIIVVVIGAVNDQDITSDFKSVAAPITITFVHLQSLINPILISLRLSYICQGIKYKLVCLIGN